MGYIYKITNVINGKQYVGQTTASIGKRFKQHVYSSRKDNIPCYIDRAIKKYGKENFKVEELERCYDEYLDEREMYWIEKFDTFRNGYNLTMGGQGSHLYTQQDVNEWINLWESGHTIKEISEMKNVYVAVIANHINHLPNYEEICKQRARDRMLESHRKPVNQYDLFGNFIRAFNSQKEAADYVNLQPGNITNACKGNLKTYGGYQWRYVDEEPPKIGEYVSQNARVVQYDTNWNKIKEYERIADAVNETGVSSSNIISCCTGRSNSSGGYIWRYKDDEYNKTVTGRIGQKRPVLQYSLDGEFIKRYDSASSAAKELNISFSSVQLCCNGHNKTSHGFVFMYEDEKKEIPNIKNTKSVIQYSLDGQFIAEYESAKEVENIFGYDAHRIRACCRGVGETGYGYKWKYSENVYCKKEEK